VRNLVDAGVNAVQVHAHPSDMALMDRLAASGIQVISGATMLPPVPDDAHPVGFDGKPNSRQFYPACYNHPSLLPLMETQCRDVLARVAAHPSVLGYWTVNEVADHDQVCYCAHCREAFRRDLERRYATPEALSAAWGTPVRAFADVEPPQPPADGTAANGYAWYDWVRFRDASMRGFLGRAIAATHRTDTRRPVGNKGIIHYFFAHGLRSPWFEIAKNSDVFWYSSYVAQWMDIANYAEVATSIRQPAWISEFNHIGAPDPQRGAECFSGFMHGLTGLVWFCYQPYAEGSAYFGLLQPDWSRGERYRAVAAAYQAARRIEPVLTEAPLVRQPVAVLFSDTTMIHATGGGEDGAVEHQFAGTVEALMRLKRSSYALADYQVAARDLRRYRAVFLPGARCVPPGLAEALRAYVEGGGTLVADAGAGYFDHGRHPKQCLRELLGVEQVQERGEPAQVPLANALRVLGSSAAVPADAALAAPVQPVKALLGTEVLCTVQGSRQPVMTLHRQGRGKVYFVAFPLGAACFRQAAGTPGLRAMAALLDGLGIPANVNVTRPGGELDLDTDAVVRQLPEGGVKHVLAVNYGVPGKRRFIVPGRYRWVADLFRGTRWPAQATAAGTQFAADMRQWEPRAFALVSDERVMWRTAPAKGAVRLRFRGEPGALVRVRLVDGSGLGTALELRLARTREGLDLPTYRLLRPPVRAEVKVWP